MKVKEESDKVGLKLNIQKTKIMASGPITSWKIDGETMKQWETLFGAAPKITADNDCSHEIRRCFKPGLAIRNYKKKKKKKDTCSLEEKLSPTYQNIKKQRYYFTNKGL